MKKSPARILACVAAAVVFPVMCSLSGSASAAEDTRYTWVDNLTLRTAPDAKAEALARLPLGAALQMLPTAEPLVHREESVPGLSLDKEVKGKPLKISGDWRHVRAGSAEGWIFDGYLSRYPYPKNAKGSDKVAMEFDAAVKMFGTKSERKWATNDSMDSESFRAMPQRLKDEVTPPSPATITWNQVAFANGGKGELAIDAHFEGTGWVVALDNMPMTYGEALLWAKRWGWFGQYGVALHDGHARLRYDYGDMKADLDYTIDCQAATCNIHYSLGSE